MGDKSYRIEQQVATVLTARGHIAAAVLRITLSMLRMSTADKSEMPKYAPKKCRFPLRVRTPSNPWILWPTTPHPKRNLDRFSRFCRVHDHDR